MKYLKAAFASVVILGSMMILGCTKEKQDGTIYGTVTDFVTGEPLDNVNVKLRPSGETTLTGSDGTYQFNNVKGGDYTLSLSKNGYSDLDDDYTITVNGNNVRRDVQLRSLYQSLRLTVNGRVTDTLDFGTDPTVVRLNYTIENNGTASFSADIRKSSDWMTVDYSRTGVLSPNGGETHVLTVRRDALMLGGNIGYLYISSGTYTKTIVVKAVGLGMPVVADPVLSNITSSTCNAQSMVTSNGGWAIVDKGFEYVVTANTGNGSTYSVSCGPGDANFQRQIPIGSGGYSGRKVRAYAYNGAYTAYSGWVYTN